MAVSSTIESLLTRRILKEKPRAEDWAAFHDLFVFTYLLTRDSPLYTIFLASKQLPPLLNSIVEDLEVIKAVADDRRAPEVDPSMASLSGSARFLQAYSAAVLGGGVTEREKTALTRFNDSSDAFKDELLEAAGSETSAAEAKTQMLAAANSIQSTEAELEARITTILGALDDFSDTSLAGTGVSLVADRGVRALEALEARFGGGTANIREELELVSGIQTTVNTLSVYNPPVLEAASGTGSAAGTGTPAEISTTVSGPYELYGTGNVLYLDVDNNPLNTFAITFPLCDYGVALTGQLDPTIPPAAAIRLANYNVAGAGQTMYITLGVDGGAPANYAITPVWNGADTIATGASLVIDFGALPPTLLATPVGGTHFEISRTAGGENHWFTIYATIPDWTLPAVDVGAYIFFGAAGYTGGGPLDPYVLQANTISAYGTWPSGHELVNSIETACPADASVSTTTIARGEYAEEEANQLSLMIVDARTGEIAGTLGGTTITSNLIDFENMGAEVGHKIRYSVPPHGPANTEYADIIYVSGGTITIATPIGLATFTNGDARVYPDPSIFSAGDTLQVRDDDMPNRLKITSVTEDLLTPAPVFNVPTTVAAASWVIERETLTITSPSNGVDSALTVQAGANDAAPALGVVGATDRGEVTEFSGDEDFRLEGVVEGDILQISGSHTIEAVGENLELVTSMPNNTTGAFIVTNADYQAYSTFIAALAAWYSAYSGLSTTISRVINPVVNAVPPQASIDLLVSQCDTYIAAYNSLLSSIAAYECREIPAVDDLFRLLKASGLNRAYDVLRSAQFSTFFSMTEEDTTHHGYFAKISRQTIAEYGNMDKYSDLMRIELSNFVFPPDLLDYEL